MTGFAVPPGDPDALRSVAAAFGGYAAEHARQLEDFRVAVKTALAGWHGSVAEQYAVAAGQACGRFTDVSETLKLGQAALNRYARALEDAQHEVARLNAAIAALPAPPQATPPPAQATPPPAQATPPPAQATRRAGSHAAMRKRAEAAAGTLRAAQHACARALEQARGALAASSPDALAAAQLLALVKKIAGHLNGPAAGQLREYGLSGWALYAHAALAAGAASRAGRDQAGQARRGPEDIVSPPAGDPLAAPRAGAGAQAHAIAGATLTSAALWALGGRARGQGHDIPRGQPPGDGNRGQPPGDGNRGQPPGDGNRGQPPEDGNMWNAPEEFANALRSSADPVDW